ncbi:MAG TPA: hypothetical protein VLK82_24605 [Candidatus Tectomicrobia bacterium]|nr:hypothetical protein [Candidatus Tectomicrobia bacterium]
MRASRHLIASAILMGFLLSAAIGSAQLMDKKGLTLEAAKKVAAAPWC